MKKLSSYSILVFSILIFIKCQSLDDNYVLDSNDKIEIIKSNEGNVSKTQQVLSIRVDYRENNFLSIYQDDLRFYYQSYFDFNFFLSCEATDEYNLSETWFISHVNEEDFFEILNSIPEPVYYPPPTGGAIKPPSGGNGPGTIPPERIVFEISFTYGKNCNL